MNARLSQGRPDLFRRDFLRILRAMIWISAPLVVKLRPDCSATEKYSDVITVPNVVVALSATFVEKLVAYADIHPR